MNATKENINYRNILIGLALFAIVMLFADFGGSFEMKYTLGITVLIAFLWLSEALPLGITSLLPIVLFPAFGVLDGKQVSAAYVNYIIFLFIGGFIMALALEKWEVHKRMALGILSLFGNSFLKIMAGFMICSAFLSMWISNTASAMMMIPMGMSITSVLNKKFGEAQMSKFNTRLFLSIAYACSIGGIATLVGTPPNLSFVRISEILYPNIPEISFAKWMIGALPVTLVMLVVTLLFLYFTASPGKNKKIELDKNYFKEQYKALGKPSTEQKRVLAVFTLLIFLWLFRKEIVIGNFHLPGWSLLFKKPGFINDGTVAVFVAFLLFVIPSSQKQKGLVTWEITQKIPWNMVFLLGGGFAIAKAFVESGLSVYLGNQLTHLADLSDTGVLTGMVVFIISLTEFTSNTATTEIMLPVISSVSNSIELNPLLLMISVTIAASMAFMFPVATVPNALVFSTGKVKMVDMLKIGLVLNVLAILVIVFVATFWLPYVFDIDLSSMPTWAQKE